MAPKRVNDGVEPSGAEKKRLKIRDQRQIPVEGGQGGRAGGSAPSGNNGLPPTIEVDKFAQARSFEISAMQRAMKAAKEAGTQRAFQTLPRHLRRRAASHNIRRLPTRLRSRARFEVPKDAAKPKKKTRSMLGCKRKLRGMSRYLNLRRRQVRKLWLETHIWHAKRMHMTDIWGHRLSDRPTAKAFRSSYRASHHGALVHDASYFQYLRLEGALPALEQFFKLVCDPTAIKPTSRRFVNGAREWTGDIHEASKKRGRLIGPASIIWQPEESDSASKQDRRTCLVRLHPAMNKLAKHAFDVAATMASHADASGVHVKALDQQLLTFEITGQRATEVVKSALKPAGLGPATKQAWRALSSAAGPGSVSEGMIFGLECFDPRLNFPPILRDDSADFGDSPLPREDVAASSRFWKNLRKPPAPPKQTKRQLDERRSQNLVPGTRLIPTAADETIPLLLVQRSLGGSAITPTSRPAATRPSVAGWTLIIPAGWGMPFFSSLVYANARVGGLRERAQQSFEAGVPHFPNDYPGTVAFAEHEARRESLEKGYWDRRPPSKRPNYAKLGTEWPWRCEMGEILSRRVAAGGAETDAAAVASPYIQPWIVPGHVVARIVDIVASSIAGVKSRSALNNIAAESMAQSLATACNANEAVPSSTLDLPSACVRVKVEPRGRGKIDDLGLIYLPTKEQHLELQQNLLVMTRSGGQAKTVFELEVEPAQICDPPGPHQLFGRITTGGFSLARGRGFALGIVPLSDFVRMATWPISGDGADLAADDSAQRLVLVRNRDGEMYRAAAIELVA